MAVISMVAGPLGYRFWPQGDHSGAPVASKADLLIEDIIWTPTDPVVGEIVTFAVKLKNQGDADSGLSQVSLHVDSVEIGATTVSSLDIGNTSTQTFTWSAQVGVHSIKATADSNNSVLESNEANNQYHATLTIIEDDRIVPAISSISPRQGTPGQTFYVNIAGANLTAATTVNFGEGITVNSLNVNSPTKMTANLSIATDAVPGTRDVSMTGPSNTGILPGGFRVMAPLVNIASVYGIASADATYVGSNAQNAVDRDYVSIWNAGSHGSASRPHWWEVDLQQDRDVIEVVVNTSHAGDYAPGLTNTYNLYVSSDGSSWTLIGSGTLVANATDPEAYADRHLLSDQAPAIRYIKYEVTGGTNWAHLAEMEVLVDSDTNQPPPPAVTSVSPDHGTRGQTLVVTISGTNFTAATAVSFGADIAVKSITVNSAGQISAEISISANATIGVRTVVVEGALLQGGFLVMQT
ncbi:MAG: discoidin domain-containing protein [Dehalococcoidia bacterium]|nr:discoidin domain-containing protein [Dehalococcoidia bacterium]